MKAIGERTTKGNTKQFSGVSSACRAHQGVTRAGELPALAGFFLPLCFMSKATLRNTEVADTKSAENAAAAAPASETKRRPIETFREGDVSASVWGRDVQYKGSLRTFYSVSFERSYRDRDGSYRYTKTFGLSDLGLLMHLAKQASDFIRGLQPPAREPLPDQAD